MLLNFNTKTFDTENTADADYDVAWGDNIREGGWESETCEPEKLLLFTSTPRKVQQWVVVDHNRCNERHDRNERNVNLSKDLRGRRDSLYKSEK